MSCPVVVPESGKIVKKKSFTIPTLSIQRTNCATEAMSVESSTAREK